MAKKKAQQSSAREQIRQQQQQLASKDRRMKIIFRSLIGVAVLVIASVITVIVLNQDEGGMAATPGNMTEDGIVFAGEGGSIEADGETDSEVPHVMVFVDYQCPHCADFDELNMETLQDEVADGNATLEIRPVALMDNSSQGTQFSTRAANTAACVAENDPNAFLEVSEQLFLHQQQAAQGAINQQMLADIAADAGADSDETNTCIMEDEFVDWVRDSTDRALSNPDLTGPSGNFGTPTIMVNDQRYNGPIDSPESLRAFIQGQA